MRADRPAPAPTSGAGGPSNVIVATPPPAAAATVAPAAGATAAPAVAPTAAPATQPAKPAGQATGPQEITVNALQGEPDNLDPNRSNFATEAAVVRQVFEPLLIFDKDLKPVPGAASSYDVSTDGKTYTFHLRQRREVERRPAGHGQGLRLLLQAAAQSRHRR